MPRNGRTLIHTEAMRRRRKHTDTEKWCPKCEQWLSHSSFRKNKAKDSPDPRRPSGLQVYCKACEDEYRKERERRPDVRAKKASYKLEYDRRPEVKAEVRDRTLRRKYGLTLNDFLTFYEDQGERCAICRRGVPMDSIHVDHDHTTGQVRGLLCKACNVGLGSFGDKPENLGRAARYLRATETRAEQLAEEAA